jgi:hypothetical protein
MSVYGVSYMMLDAAAFAVGMCPCDKTYCAQFQKISTSHVGDPAIDRIPFKR